MAANSIFSCGFCYLALFVFCIWDALTPIPFIEINRVAPTVVENAASYDTDGDGYKDALLVKADQ